MSVAERQEASHSADPPAGPTTWPIRAVKAVVPWVIRRGKRLALSPCTWLVAIAIVGYLAFARAQYTAMAGPVGACDLGIFHQATQGWAFAGWPDVPIKGFAQLGDHFSPMFAILSPLLWIHDSPFMLIAAQVVLLCLSAVPVYLAFLRMYGRYVASAMAAAYLCSYAVVGAITFPVHEVMFTAPLLAWGLERALAGRWTAAAMIFAPLVWVKEDLGVVVALFGLFVLLHRQRRHALFLIVWGLGWFVLAVKVIIPAVNPTGFTYANDYRESLHSDGIFSGLPYIIAHPVEIVQILFNDPAKVDTWTHLLLPVGFIALASPLALLVAPLMVGRMLSSRNTQWSWLLYYDMALMPIIFMAMADGLRRIINVGAWWRRRRNEAPVSLRVGSGHRVAVIVATVAVTASVYTSLDLTAFKWMRGEVAFVEAQRVPAMRAAISHVPKDVEVRATNNIVIPLLARNTVTLIGSQVDRGNWAVLDTKEPGCPISESDIPRVIRELTAMGFRTTYDDGRFRVMHREKLIGRDLGTGRR